MRRVVLWASQRTEVLALIKTTTDLNVGDFRWTVAHSQKTGGMEVARLEYARYGRHHFFQSERHRLSLYAQVYATLVDAVAAERVVVEALERAWHAAKDFNPGAGSAFAWLSEIARSVAQGQRRPPQDPTTSASAAL